MSDFVHPKHQIMKKIILFLITCVFYSGSTLLLAQTSNGTPLANYASCLELEKTSFDKGCLASGHRAQLFVTNRCDQTVNIKYRFTGNFTQTNEGTGTKTAYQIKPGKRTRLYFCYTVENSGSIEIVSVQPIGSQGGGYSSGNGGTSSGSSSSNSGSSSSGSYNSGTTNGNNSSGSSNSPRQATSLEEIRQRQAAAQNRNSNSGTTQPTAEEVQQEQIRRQVERQMNTSGNQGKKSSASGSGTSGGRAGYGQNSTARSSTTNTQAAREHEYRRKQQQEQAQRERQAIANREHQQAMAELGIAAILVHLTAGYILYDQVGDVNGYESSPRGNGVHHQLTGGYNLSYFDLLNNNIDIDPITIDLGFTYRLNLLQSDHFGLGLRGDLTAGHSLLFDTRLEAGLGANAYFGFKNFRLFAELQSRDNTLWMIGDNTLRWRYHRFSIGPLFSWNGNRNHLKLLFQWDYFRLPSRARRLRTPDGISDLNYPVGAGMRIEYLRRNGIQFFAQYNPLIASPNNNSIDAEAPMGTHYAVGIRRSWDWHKTGSLDYPYQSLRAVNFDNSNFYLSVMNPVLEWGSLQRGPDKLPLDAPQLSFNLLTFESQISLYNDLMFTLGAGVSSMRRLSGGINYSERTGPGPYTQYNEASGDYIAESFYPLDPAIGISGRANKISRYSFGEFELPFGLHYFFPSTGMHRFWTAAKMVPAFLLGEDGEEIYENAYRDFQLFYRVGAGVDLPYTSGGNLRWGIYYLMRPNSLTWENVEQNLHGVQIQMAYGF